MLLDRVVNKQVITVSLHARVVLLLNNAAQPHTNHAMR